ncbi:MAG: DoxX family protein [Deltaproteobacteria bacterium]|nr:DoxX family protein [Deltaproteobacteria bacterium]
MWPYRLARTLVAAVFLWSGGAKMMDPAAFAEIVEAYELIPDIWIMAIAVGLPALEFVAALGLLLDLRGSLGVISGLLILFMGVLGYGIWMGFDIDCGCFGPQDPEAEAFHSLRPALYRDFLMMAGAGYLYLWRYCRSAKPIRLSDMIQQVKRRSRG